MPINYDNPELRKLVRTLEKAFDGDSNDAEHDAAVALVDYLKENPPYKIAK